VPGGPLGNLIQGPFILKWRRFDEGSAWPRTQHKSFSTELHLDASQCQPFAPSGKEGVDGSFKKGAVPAKRGALIVF